MQFIPFSLKHETLEAKVNYLRLVSHNPRPSINKTRREKSQKHVRVLLSLLVLPCHWAIAIPALYTYPWPTAFMLHGYTIHL